MSLHFRIALLMLLLLPVAAHAAGEPFTQVGISLSHDNNINNVASGSEEDTILGVQGLIGYARPLDERTLFNIGVKLSHEHYFDFSELDNSGIGLSAEYQQRTSIRPEALWFGLSAGVAYREFRDTLRDGNALFAGLRIGKHPVPRLALMLSLAHEEVDADSPVFDTRSTGLSFGAEYDIGPITSLYGAISRIEGESVSTLTTPLMSGGRRMGSDPSYGGSRTAYLLESTTNQLEFGLKSALSPASVLSGGIRYGETNTELAGNDYDKTVLHLRYRHNF
jgi:hypothetical protein